MKNRRILSALIGLAGATNNNGKTDNTDTIVKKALLSEDSDEIVEEIHREKFTISPSCETCASPCGNTSDYDMKRLDNEEDAKIKELKLAVISELERIAHNDKLPEVTYKAISFVGYDLIEESYNKLLEEMKQW